MVDALAMPDQDLNFLSRTTMGNDEVQAHNFINGTDIPESQESAVL